MSEAEPKETHERKPRPICGAKTRSGGVCQSTALMANGRCRVHGGASTGAPVTTGRYARVARGKLAAHLAANPPGETADMAQEIALCQGLTGLVLEKLDAENPNPETLVALVELSERINRMQARLIRSRNETALTAAEVRLLQVGIVSLIDEFIPDENGRRLFIARLSELIPRRALGRG